MTRFTRRDWLTLTLGAGAAAALDLRELLAQQPQITRAIPKSGERLPVIGLGSSATFSQVARSEDITALRDVLKTLLDNGFLSLTLRPYKQKCPTISCQPPHHLTGLPQLP